MKIKYENLKSEYSAEVKIISAHVVQLTGELPSTGSGFKVYRNDGLMLGNYVGFTTVYKAVEGGYQYSDDRSVYVEPIIPEVIIVEPTAEELAEKERQQKIADINSQILALKAQLKSLDYKTDKYVEQKDMGLPLDYTIEEIYTEKQPLRDQINELETALSVLMTEGDK